MKFHREGIPTLLLVVAFTFISVGCVWYFLPEQKWLHLLIWALCVFLLIVVLQFFRSPSRKWSSSHETGVVSPADGKVVVIEETEETEYYKDRRIQVSIFMSPINVHVNRYPIGGEVKYVKYHPGKYLVAWHPKSSTDNERTTIVVEKDARKTVLFRQIAGALARRIVYYCKQGDKAQQSGEFGFIKFGSRVDVFLPLGTKVNVQIGDVVKGGITVIAEFPSV